jgi:hypothetical protein
MKKIILFYLISTSIAIAQDCKTFAYFKNGSEFEMSNFDQKQKLISKSKSKVVDIKNAVSATEAKVETKSFNAKGKEQFSSYITFKCNSQGISMSMKNMMNAEQMAGFKDMEMKIEETFIEYPRDMKVGAKLKDGNFKAEIFTGAMKIMTMNLSVSERQIVAKEDITTSFGNISCYKLTYKGNMKTIVGMSFEVTEWYSPLYGIVKTETLRNGKSMGYSLLTNAVIK